MMFLALLLVRDGIVINKGNAIFICLVIFLAIGLFEIIKFLKNFGFIVILVYLMAFAYFIYFYFNLYPVIYYPQGYFMDTYVEAIEYAEKYDKDIYLEPIPSGTIWAALASQTSPYDFYNAEDQDEHFGNLYFYIPNEFDKDNVYGVYEEDAEKLKSIGFKCRHIDNFYVCVYEGENINEES